MESAKYSAAIPLFLDLIESDSEDCTIHYMVGQCYKFTGQLPDAIDSLKKMVVNFGFTILFLNKDNILMLFKLSI